jgi:hypothetical protein
MGPGRRARTQVQAVYFGTGRDICGARRDHGRRAGMTADVLLETYLCAWYGAAQILFDVALQVRRGEVVLGRNGARQVHHAQGADGHGSAQRRRGVPGAGPVQPQEPTTRHAWVWALCRKTAASSPT